MNNTRFELNIKRFGIKGDDHALYLYLDGNLVVKIGYTELEAAWLFLRQKANLNLPAPDEEKMPNDE